MLSRHVSALLALLIALSDRMHVCFGGSKEKSMQTDIAELVLK